MREGRQPQVWAPWSPISLSWGRRSCEKGRLLCDPSCVSMIQMVAGCSWVTEALGISWLGGRGAGEEGRLASWKTLRE
jgi:hypothetical protein